MILALITAPFCTIKFPRTVRFPPIDISDSTNNRPFTETSLVTNSFDKDAEPAPIAAEPKFTVFIFGALNIFPEKYALP